MADHRTIESASADAAPDRSGTEVTARIRNRWSGAEWLARAALGFAIASIMALAALPWIAGYVAAPKYAELIELIAPARGLLTQVNHSLATEGAAVRDLGRDGERLSAERHRSALASETIAIDTLRRLVASLGRVEQTAFEEMDRVRLQWHATTAVQSSAGARVMPGRDTLYERLLDAVVRLDGQLHRRGQARREEILRLEALRSRLATVVGVLALASALAVGWLGRRLRVYAVMLEERQAAIDRAEESRERLLRGVTHDLKNPLQAIAGHAELLADEVRGPMSPDQQDSVRRIRGSVRSMQTLITDLLELARAESGQLRIEPRDIDVAALVGDVVEQFRPAAELSGHVIAPLVAPASVRARTDEARVRQILGNLLTNAVKYTPPGGTIAVGLDVRDGANATSPRRAFAIKVSDSGDGIPEDQQEALFGEFTRQGKHQRIPGVGLGLSISRRIARLLGGDLTVASRPSVGSTFTLWLPVDGSRPDGRVPSGRWSAAGL